MLDRPQLGQFLLIELGSPEEAAWVFSIGTIRTRSAGYLNSMMSRPSHSSPPYSSLSSRTAAVRNQAGSHFCSRTSVSIPTTRKTR